MRRERAAPARCSRAAAGAGRGGGAARRPGGRGSFFRAVAVAAAMFRKVDLAGKKVACVVSGGNIDVLCRIVSSGS